MNEKRFSVRLRSECDGVVYSFFDGDKLIDVDMIVDLLNRQDYAIEVKQKYIEQLQDLCGKSDGENAKLRIENKKLKNRLNNDL